MKEKKAREILDGLLLGDGSLRRHKTTARYAMSQCKHTISIEDHLKWEYWLGDGVFSVLGVDASVKLLWGTRTGNLSKGQKYQIASLWTKYSLLLAPIHDEWYTGGEWIAQKGAEHLPNCYYVRGATKIVPKRLMDAVVLPTCTLVQWFLGDGGSGWNHLENPTPAIHTSFSACGFSEEEVYHLMSMLNSMGFKTVKPGRQSCKAGSGLRIILAQESVNDFMNLIKPHVLEIFGDSIGPSYKDIIKYRHKPPISVLSELTELRRKIG